MNKKTYPPELIAAIAKSSALYEENTRKIKAYAQQLESDPEYVQAREKVNRLHALFLEQKENE